MLRIVQRVTQRTVSGIAVLLHHNEHKVRTKCGTYQYEKNMMIKRCVLVKKSKAHMAAVHRNKSQFAPVALLLQRLGKPRRYNYAFRCMFPINMTLISSSESSEESEPTPKRAKEAEPAPQQEPTTWIPHELSHSMPFRNSTPRYLYTKSR